MRYQSSAALRRALEDRLGASSRETHVALARLRRRVVFERLVARLERTEPGRWVVKGGMAMEVRLHDDARPEVARMRVGAQQPGPRREESGVSMTV